MTKKLKDILTKIDYEIISGSDNVEINNISFDSRKIKPGSLFIAVKGYETDGHKFIDSAVKNGAVAVIAENIENINTENINLIKVSNTSKTAASAASEFFDNPSHKLKLIGITGTNGKTTVATLLYEYFIEAGFKSGLISTVKNRINKKEIEAKHTTPDAITFNGLLKEMVDEGCEYCFAEVSSHAIHQNRIFGLKLSGAVFTNITHEHLDYHKTFSEYLKVKKQFFDKLPEDAFALVNIDDKNGKIILQNTKAKKYTYALKNPADFKTKILEMHIDGTLISINDKEFWYLLAGKYNAYNITAVYATAVLLGQNPDAVMRILSGLKPVKGRFETIEINGITAVIDYAHTPDALENILNTINELKKTGQNLICIIGAGGNRDKTKRPVMAKIAFEKSDKLILTSDNPRNENPEDILNDMFEGLNEKQKNKTLKIPDRKEAIKIAANTAKKGDIILIAGKGHENYQIINGKKYHFDDKETVENILKNI
ncbi:MAG: UDP-N-acetylmuramoyl-L-alanyl-D-glutamate--2,6-diaminopimelate ligase [Chlorobi bacterium]|nr:UDP-N-acetylmuramoyl-L-alanyl-D-glutamate--2,6-diaminopimelate ligase [Chlorobiota bacterium]